MRNRPGFALVVVLVLMAVGSALTIATISSSLAEDETARLGTLQRRALVAAESALWRSAGILSASAMRLAPPGPTTVSDLAAGDTRLTVTADKVDTSNVWLVVVATIHGSSGTIARHRLGMSLQIPRDTTVLRLYPVPERAWAELF